MYSTDLGIVCSSMNFFFLQEEKNFLAKLKIFLSKFMNRKIVHYVNVHFFTRFEIYYFLSPIVASCSRIGRYFFNKTADGRPL